MDLNTVGELIDWLATQPRDRPVVMASDAVAVEFDGTIDVNTAGDDAPDAQLSVM